MLLLNSRYFFRTRLVLLTSCLPDAYPSGTFFVRPIHGRATTDQSPQLIGLTADGDSEFIVWDAELPGFGVRVKPSGAKSYVIQYRTRDSGRSRRKTIGRHGPLMSLQQARSIARGLLADAARGRDPVGEHRSRRKSPTISELADRYIEEHAMPKKRAGSIRNDRSILERHILPRLGQMKVQDVEPADIQRLHNALRETPYQANRTIALLSKMFSLSVRWGLRNTNPTEGIEKFHEEARHRWLSGW
jgi:hypothetical protein